MSPGQRCARQVGNPNIAAVFGDLHGYVPTLRGDPRVGVRASWCGYWLFRALAIYSHHRKVSEALGPSRNINQQAEARKIKLPRSCAPVTHDAFKDRS